MMELERLLDGDDERFEARLLRTALADEPPDGAMTRAAIALGAGASASAVVGSAAVAKAAIVPSVGAAHAGAGAGAKIGALAIAKWVSVGLVSGLVVTSSLQYATDPVLRAALSGHHGTDAAKSTETGAHRATAAPKPDRAPSLPARGPAAPEDVAIADAPPTPPHEARGATAAPSNAAPAMEAEPADLPRVASLSVELSLIEEARRALVARDPAGVARALDAYAAAPRTGVLQAEAELLRIEALVQRGDVTTARAQAARALAAAPKGPHAARLREIASLPSR